jgi:outer membrane protein TolC
VADYRQQVLVAFAEVQESLTALELFALEAEALQRTEESATSTYQLALARYESGINSYLDRPMPSPTYTPSAA